MMERTEKIGFAEWCAEYRKTLPESKRNYQIGDFLSDIDSDLHQNPFMAGCCDRKQWMEHIYHHACDDAKAAFCNLWKMYEQDTQEGKPMLMEQKKPLGFGEWCWEFYARALEHGRTITAFEWVAVDASYAAGTFAELEQCADQNQWERYSMTQYGAAGMRVFRKLWQVYKREMR